MGYTSSSHGIRGNVKIKPTGDAWLSLVPPFSARLVNSKNEATFTCLDFQVKPDYVLATIERFSQPEDWEGWTQAEIQVDQKILESAQKEESEFYYYQLEGLDVLDENGNRTGYKVSRVFENSVHSILELDPDPLESSPQKILIPFVSEWVGEISLEKNTIQIFGWEDWIAL